MSGFSPDAVWAAMKSVESGGNGNAVGPDTPYGNAYGSTQLLPATAQAMAQKIGVDWQPGLLKGNSPDALGYQDRLGRAYFDEGLAASNGDPLAAAAYYHGGPDMRLHGPKTEAYVQKVAARADGGSDDLPSADAIMQAYGWAGQGGGSQQPAAVQPSQPASDGSDMPSPDEISKAYGWAPPHEQAAPVVVTNKETGKPYNDAQERAYAQLMADKQLDPSAAPGSEFFPRGLASASDTPKAGEWYVGLDGVKRQAPSDVASDIGEGFWRPIQDYGHALGSAERRPPNALLPTSVGDFAKGFLPDPTPLALLAGAPAAGLSAVAGAITRPLARQAAKVLPTPYEGPQLSLAGGHASLSAPKPLDPVDTAQSIMETSLEGARAALPEGVPLGALAPKVSAPTLPELQAAKTAAYKRLDDMGVSYRPEAAQSLATGINDELSAANISPMRHPKAFSVAQDITSRLNSGKPVALSDLDQLRQVVWRDVAAPKNDDAEKFFGRKIINNIDDFVNSATPDQMVNGDAEAAAKAMADARTANSRYRKVQTINDEADSAKLRASSTYSGGNFPNALRQELRPYADPTSGKQIPGMTPAEAQALRNVVEGTPWQNVLRYGSKLLSNKFLQTGAMISTPHGVGMPLQEAAAGILRGKSEKATLKAVKALTDMMATGGNPGGPAPLGPDELPAISPVPLLSGPGAVGVNVLAQPLRVRPSVVSLGTSR